jgi:hypothetical protein
MAGFHRSSVFVAAVWNTWKQLHRSLQGTAAVRRDVIGKRLKWVGPQNLARFHKRVREKLRAPKTDIYSFQLTEQGCSSYF